MEHDDYYSKEGEKFEQPSTWYGKGAEKLNLCGVVDKETFNKLLEGKLPNGIQIGATKNGEVKHRAGFDLTLSVPKSWSIAHYATKDPLFAKITEQAAKLTADLIERDCAMASRYENGKQHTELTGNLVFAFHFHRLSRELDMQDHIHMNVMNMTQRKDGEWRALKSDNPQKPIHDYSDGFLERVRARKRHYGDIFSLHIAHLAQKNNLAVKFDEKGKWELKGISKDLIDAFSTRRKQIEENMQEKGLSGANAAEMSNLATRQKKKALTREEIETNLDERLSQFSAIQIKDLLTERVSENQNEADTQERTVAAQAIDYAIAHLSEAADVITEEKILACAMKQYHAKPSVKSLLETIALKEQQKQLFVLTDNGSRRYVSAIHVQREKEILSFLPNLKSISNSFVAKETKLKHWFDKNPYFLSAEQTSLIKKTLKSDDLLHIIDTKTNKDSKLPNFISECAKSTGFEAIILCSSKKEAEDRQQTTQVSTMTVSQYLHQMQAQQNIAKSRGSSFNLSKQLLVIENAHRLSTKQGHALLALQDQYQNRSILIHDSKQPQSLQPGNFIQLLSENGVQVEKIKSDIKNIIPISVARHEIPEKETRLDTLARDFVNYQKLEPKSKVLILGQNKTDVESLNQSVQAKLLGQGLLSKEHINTTHYQSVFLTSAQRTQATQYKEGQLVSFSKDYRSLGIDKQHYYTVESLNTKKNQVVLRNANQHIIWDPSKIAGVRDGVVSVFNPKKISLHQGDQVISTHSCNSTTKGRSFTVVEIKNNGVVLQDEYRKLLKLTASDPRLHHLALGYARTTSSAYMQATNIVLADQASNTRVTNSRQHYQILSQATNKVVLYTDDIKKHDLTLARYKGDAKPVVSYLYEKLSAQQHKQVSKDTLSRINTAEQRVVKRERHLSGYFQNSTPFKEINRSELRKLMRYHISKLSDSEAVISKHALEQEISSHNPQLKAQLDFRKLDKEFSVLLKKGVLISCKLNTEEPAFTTRRSLKIEAAILQDAKALMHAKASFYDEKVLTQKLNTWQERYKNLTQSQQTAVKQLLLTNHKLVLINGLAGVGKTTLLEAANTLLAEKQVKLIGLAPTNEATRQLQIRGIEAHTLDSYLIQLNNSKKEGTFDAKAKSLLVLDEASMASSQKFRQLLSLTKHGNISLAFIGDVKQLPSIEQGKMFWMLQKFGVDTTLVNEIVRQKESPALLNIVKQIYRGNFKGAIERLDKMGHVIDDKKLLNENPNLSKEDSKGLREARLQKLVDTISSYSSEKRNNTCVITPANQDRIAFNCLYREALKQKQEIAQNGSQTGILVPSNLTPSAKAHANNYQVGQVLLFNKSLPDCDIKRGDYLTIKEANISNNYLVLENEKGEKTGVNAARFRGENSRDVSVYNHEEREIAKNDLIRWRYTDKALDRINMQQAKVLEVQGNQATIQLENKQKQVLDLTHKNNQHWDYAYASTVYSEQGNTKQFAALYMLNEQRNLASQPGFLVAMTRAIESGLLVTDDKEKLIQRIEHNTAVKTSTLEALNYKVSIQTNSSKFNNGKSKIHQDYTTAAHISHSIELPKNRTTDQFHTIDNSQKQSVQRPDLNKELERV